MKNREKLILKEALNLLNGMVEGGEKHSKKSREIVRKAFSVLKSESEGE